MMYRQSFMKLAQYKSAVHRKAASIFYEQSSLSIHIECNQFQLFYIFASQSSLVSVSAYHLRAIDENDEVQNL